MFELLLLIAAFWLFGIWGVIALIVIDAIA